MEEIAKDVAEPSDAMRLLCGVTGGIILSEVCVDVGLRRVGTSCFNSNGVATSVEIDMEIIGFFRGRLFSLLWTSARRPRDSCKFESWKKKSARPVFDTLSLVSDFSYSVSRSHIETDMLSSRTSLISSNQHSPMMVNNYSDQYRHLDRFRKICFLPLPSNRNTGRG